jgi:hypothetical protein
MAKWRRRSQTMDSSEPRSGTFDLARFMKLCGMLASPSDGERASAAAKASEMLKAADLTWNEVIKDAKTLNEHIELGNAREEEVRAHRFWKTRSASERARA